MKSDEKKRGQGPGVGGRSERRYLYSQRGSALIMGLVLMILVLGLSGVAFSLFRFSREKGVRPFQASAATGVADSGKQQAITALQKKAAEEAVSDPAMAFFYWGGDLNGDGVLAKDGEVDWNRNGKLDVSPVTNRKSLEDLNGDSVWNRPDGALEGPSGELLDEDTGMDGQVDFQETGYHSLTNPDPNGDNYHPIFNPTGTEGNGRRDTGEPDNGNGRLDTVEDGSRWIRWGRKNSNVSKVNRGEGEAALDGSNYLRVMEVNSLIDLNGPDHLAARLLNNLFRTIQLSVIDTVNNAVVRQTLGQNARGLEYSADLDATIGTIFNTPLAPTDPHAVQLIKRRNQLPGKRFATKDQVFEAIKKLGLLTLNDTDEWLRLREFITVYTTADPTTIRQDPTNPTGPPILDPRPPVNINTASKEVLKAVIMAGIDFPSLPGPDNTTKAINAFDAAESLASIIFQYRMAQANATVFPNQGAFRTWNKFEAFMTAVKDNLAALIPDTVPNATNRREILSTNKDRLVAQANPNSRLQRFNPDTTTSLPIDKSQIPYPTAEFSFSSDGLFEITSLGILSAEETRLPPFMAPTEPDRVLSPGGGEIARSETVSVVKVFEVLRHTTQEEFEGNEPLFKRTDFSSKSYPKNVSDASFSITPPQSITVPLAGPIAVDEKSGLIYVIGVNGVGESGIQIITPSGALGSFIPVSSPSALAIAPAYPGTTLGRLFVGATEAGVYKIKVFDVNGTVDALSATPMPDIAGLSGPPIKMIHDPAGRDLPFSLGTPSANDIGKYAFRDLPLAPSVTEANTAITTPPLDIAHDRRLDQLFAIGSNGVGENILLRIRDADNGALESFPLSNFGAATPRFVETDPENGMLFIVSSEGSHLRLRKYSTNGNPTAELDSLLLTGLNTNASDGRLAVDATEHLIFVVGGSQLAIVSDRGERLEQIDINPDPLLLNMPLPAGPHHVAVNQQNKQNKKLFISSQGGNRVDVYTYSVSSSPSIMDGMGKLDGQVRLIANASSVSTDPAKLLARSDFDSDLHLMRLGPDAPPPPGAAAKPTGQFVSIGAPPPGQLLPDGALLSSQSAPGAVSASLLSYSTTELYGIGLDGAGPNAQGPGLRRGAMEFWVKLPRLSGINPTDPPEKVILYRSFLRTRIDPNVFIRKSDLHTDQQELQAILGGTASVDPASPITFSPAMADYFIFTRLFLDSFQDTNGDGLIDQSALHLIRYADIPPNQLTVSYTDTVAGPKTGVAFDPVESNQVESPAVLITSLNGEWHHFAFSWKIETNAMPGGNNKEKAQQELFVNGALQAAGTLSKNSQFDPDGGNGYETIFDLLDNDGDLIVDDGFSQPTAPSFLQFGAIIFDPAPPTANIQGTVDDLVLYRDETALPAASFAPSRFSAQGEDFTDDPLKPPDGLFDPGEPFEDVNLNGGRTASGDSFTDTNSNGIWDIGEPFTDGNGNNRYDQLGEPFADGTCSNPPGRYVDYNKNGQCDPGELYWDRDKNKSYRPPETFTDANANRIYDGNGYFANTFTATIPAGSRIGALAWTEVKPTGTAINVELILRAADGRILWRWFSDNNAGEEVPLNLLVPEEARLEYRVNFLIQETARASAVLDDLTVTVISNPKVLYSQETSRPFQFDPSLGPVSGSSE